MNTKTRNRKDHIIPQSYMRGFIAPNRRTVDSPLWYFDVKRRKWSEKSPRAIAFEKGFYDYTEGSTPDATADDVFRKLENDFPKIRDKIILENFSTWTQHKNFLLRFVDMLRARSRLFRQENVDHSHHLPMHTLTEPVKTVSKQRAWKAAPFQPQSIQDHGRLLKNKAITDMRSEIEKEAAKIQEWHWALRYTTNPADPIIINEDCCMMDGKAPDREAAADALDTLLFFPLSWQMCLVGGRQRFDKKTDKLDPNDLKKLRGIYIETAREFIISPTKINI